MSTGPRGQYTGWRIAAIRSNETVGKCILARVGVVRYRKGGDTHAHTSLLSHSLLSLSLYHISLSFPSASTFHRALLLSRYNSRPCINYLVTPRVPRLDPRNLCDLFGFCSHSSYCHAAYNLPLRRQFFLLFSNFLATIALNDRLTPIAAK